MEKNRFPFNAIYASCERMTRGMSFFGKWLLAFLLCLGLVPMVQAAWTPGLLGGYHTKYYMDFTSPPICTNVYRDAQCTTNYSVSSTIPSTNEVVVVDGHATLWSTHRVWTYWGQIYLAAGKTELGGYIDDRIFVEIDGSRVLDGTKASCQKIVVTVENAEAGWHDFKLCASNLGGGGGPASSGNGFGGGLGFYIKEAGKTEKTYPVEDGTMSRFRHEDGAGFSDLLRVSGMPCEAGEVEPPYGLEKTLTEGKIVHCTAPATVDGNGIRATCAGYSIGTVDPTTGRMTETASGTANEVDYRHGTAMGGLT